MKLHLGPEEPQSSFSFSPERKRQLIKISVLGAALLAVLFLLFLQLQPPAAASDSSLPPSSVKDTLAEVSLPASSEEERILQLLASSVEEDLTVIVADQNRKPVAGTAFTLEITSSSGETSYHSPDPETATLSLTGMEPGEYQIRLQPTAEFSAPPPVSCQVQAKVEYIPVENIQDKVVSDSEVDASNEDAGFRPTRPDSPPIIDEESKPASSQPESSSTPSSSPVSSKGETVPPVSSQPATEDPVRYLPVLSDAGYLLYSNGETSFYYPQLDRYGCLVSAYYYAEEVDPEAEPGGDPISFEIFDETGRPVLGVDGQPLFWLEEAEEEDLVTSSYEPDGPSSEPDEPSSEPDEPSSEPEKPSSESDEPSSEPDGPSSEPEEPSSKPEEPSSEPDEPSSEPDVSTEEEASAPEPPVENGWKTLDGNTYYIGADGEPLTGCHLIGGINYYFDPQGIRRDCVGIDVSKYQGSIDWQAVKDSGISFVMIRVGYRGYSSGVLVEDPYFRQNIDGAQAVGLKVGVYFFTQAITAQEAVEEASMVLELISGYSLDYPVAFDTEYVGGARADDLTVSQRTAITVAFCETIRSSGYTPAVYASKNWFDGKLDQSQLTDYKIWLAHYTTSTDSYEGQCDIWQYAATGSVGGIAGGVDMNISYTID